MVMLVFCVFLLFQFPFIFSDENEEKIKEKFKQMLNTEFSSELMSINCNLNSYLPNRNKVLIKSFDDSSAKYGLLFIEEWCTIVLLKITTINNKDMLSDFKVIKSNLIESVNSVIKNDSVHGTFRTISDVSINNKSKFSDDIELLKKTTLKSSHNLKTLKGYSILKKYEKDDLFDIFFTFNLCYVVNRVPTEKVFFYRKEVQYGLIIALMDFKSEYPIKFDEKYKSNKEIRNRYFGVIINDLPVFFNLVNISTSDQDIPYEFFSYVYFNFEKRKIDLEPKINGFDFYSKCSDYYLAQLALFHDDKSYLDNKSEKYSFSQNSLKHQLELYLEKDFFDKKYIWDFQKLSFECIYRAPN